MNIYIYIYKSQSNLPRLQFYITSFLIDYNSICNVDICYNNKQEQYILSTKRMKPRNPQYTGNPQNEAVCITFSKTDTYHPNKTYRIHKRILSREQSPSSKQFAQEAYILMNEDFNLVIENLSSLNTILFLSLQIAHKRHKGAALHNFLAFFLIVETN